MGTKIFHRALWLAFAVLWFFTLSAAIGLAENYDEFDGDDRIPLAFGDVVARNENKWPNGLIPYEIDRRFSPLQKHSIISAMKLFEVKTCIRFLSRNNSVFEASNSYLYIRKVMFGCNTEFIGYQPTKSRQQVTLAADDCFDAPGKILHELLHVVGFFHTHTRYDRDDFVTIYWNTIIPMMQNNFMKLKAASESFLNSADESLFLRYDYWSLMHYPLNAFAKKPATNTIVPKKGKVENDIDKIGQRLRFSALDVAKVNLLYNCFGVN